MVSKLGGAVSKLFKRPVAGGGRGLEWVTFCKAGCRSENYYNSSRNFATAATTSDYVDKKLEHFTKISPTPISIAEFIERGQVPGKLSEAESYTHLVQEALVRLSHMISEVRQFPK